MTNILHDDGYAIIDTIYKGDVDGSEETDAGDVIKLTKTIVES